MLKMLTMIHHLSHLLSVFHLKINLIFLLKMLLFCTYVWHVYYLAVSMYLYKCSGDYWLMWQVFWWWEFTYVHTISCVCTLTVQNWYSKWSIAAKPWVASWQPFCSGLVTCPQVLPHKVKCSMCTSDHYIQSTFFYLVRFLTKVVNDQCSSITKAVYLPYQTFYLYSLVPLEWTELQIECFFHESILLHLIFAHTAYSLCTAELGKCINH